MQTGAKRGLANVLYVFDAKASRFTVQAFAAGILSGFGHDPVISIRDFHGEVQFVPGSYEKCLARMMVNTGDMEPPADLKREDREKMDTLIRKDVLQVSKFPNARYESTEIKVHDVSDGVLDASVNGELTLHGVTRQHNFYARVLHLGTMLRISGNFTLSQADYNIARVSIAGGALRVKDELKFNFEVVARQTDSQSSG